MNKIKSLCLLAIAMLALTLSANAQQAPNIVNEKLTPAQAAWQPPAEITKIIGKQPVNVSRSIMDTLRHYGVKPEMDAETAELYAAAAAREIKVKLPSLTNDQIVKLIKLPPGTVK
jgi:hypothetical protein